MLFDLLHLILVHSTAWRDTADRDRNNEQFEDDTSASEDGEFVIVIK